MASVIGKIVDLTVSGKQFLRVSHRPKFLRFSFSPSDWEIRTFGAIVLSTSNVLERFQGFIRHINAALDHQFLNITKAQVEAEVHPNGATNNVRMGAMARID